MMSNFQDALPHTITARKIYCAKYGEAYPTCLQQIANVGIGHMQVGDYPTAVANLELAYAGYRQLNFADDSAPIQLISFYLADMLLRLGKISEAVKLAAPLDPKALSSAAPGEGWDRRLDALRGMLLIAQGQRTEGIALLKPAVEYLEEGQVQKWISEPMRKYLDAALRAGAKK